jgi:hypothetical protein
MGSPPDGAHTPDVFNCFSCLGEPRQRPLEPWGFTCNAHVVPRSDSGCFQCVCARQAPPSDLHRRIRAASPNAPHRQLPDRRPLTTDFRRRTTDRQPPTRPRCCPPSSPPRPRAPPSSLPTLAHLCARSRRRRWPPRARRAARSLSPKPSRPRARPGRSSVCD